MTKDTRKLRYEFPMTDFLGILDKLYEAAVNNLEADIPVGTRPN